jgi:hypothetical protein
VRELLQPSPYAVGVDELILGWFLRSLRATLFVRHLARLANHLADAKLRNS